MIVFACFVHLFTIWNWNETISWPLDWGWNL